MLLRIVVCLGMAALAYFIGREVGRAESVREELRRAREEGTLAPAQAAGVRRVS